MMRSGGRLLHLQHKMVARQEIPGLNDGTIALRFKLPGNPLCPVFISMGVTDKKVPDDKLTTIVAMLCLVSQRPLAVGAPQPGLLPSGDGPDGFTRAALLT